METAEGIHPAPPLPTHHTPHAGARRQPRIRLSWGVQARGIRHPVNMHNHCISGIWGGTGKWRIPECQCFQGFPAYWSSNLASSAVPRGFHPRGFLLSSRKPHGSNGFAACLVTSRVASRSIRIHVTAHIGDALGAWWARAAPPLRMIGNNFGPYMPQRDVWETGTLFRSACASCMPRHAKLNNIVGKQQLRAVPCGLRIPGHTQLAILLTDGAWRLPSAMRCMPGHT